LTVRAESEVIHETIVTLEMMHDLAGVGLEDRHLLPVRPHQPTASRTESRWTMNSPEQADVPAALDVQQLVFINQVMSLRAQPQVREAPR
jgi:hypothetical protein